MDKNVKETTNEIDLLELFSHIGNWFGRIFNGLGKLGLTILYFFIRNIIWIIVLLIAGGITGYAVHKTTRLFYKSQLIGHSNTLTSNEVVYLINNWNYTRKYPEFDTLVKNIQCTYLLDVNKDEKWDIIEDFNDIYNTDTTILSQRMPYHFCVQIEVYDTSTIQKFKTALFNYLNTDERIQEENKIRIKQDKELMKRLGKEMAVIDSMRKFEYFNKNQLTAQMSNNMLMIGKQENKLYYEEMLELIEQQQEVQKSLMIGKKPFDIVLNFSIPEKEENNVMFMIFKYMKIFFFIGIVIILYFDQRKYLKEQLNKAK